jgi:DinB family protein
MANPTVQPDAAAQAYIAGLLQALGTQPPLEILRTTPARLRDAIQGLSEDQLYRREAPDRWSVAHVLQHLADSELVGAYRFRMILAHDRPEIQAYDQDLWAERLHYDLADPTESLADFTAIRAANVRLFERSTPSERERVGIHAERGEESLGFLQRVYAGHDIVHLRQVERIRQTIASPGK